MAGLLGIDVGGTFTDLIYARDGISMDTVVKVPSTPDDPSQGLIDAIKTAGIELSGLDLIVHGTTIATNAVIERRGAPCALITTKGFRDLLEIGRRDRQRMYGLTGVQNPLIRRAMRWEVDERIDHRGEVLTALDEVYLAELAVALAKEEISAVVISFLHSYANPVHEQRAKAIMQTANPGWEVVISSDIVREYYEFERTSTATVQAYLQPLISRYARNLEHKLKHEGYGRKTFVMQSNGGLIPLGQLSDSSAKIVRSGPAAGVMAAAQIAARAGFNKVITADMGGTSYDVAVIIDGVPRIADTTNLDFRVPLRLPMIDVHTIGAGGGSIAYLDRGGVLQVGPRSAGAVPGPICFGRGGAAPTVTDANAVLGRINPEHPIGLKHLSRLDTEAARQAMAVLGQTLGLDVERTAEAILTVVNNVMARRTQLLSVAQGHDPRDFALVAFGGAGPLHGAAIMREVGIRNLLVPMHPGVLCALGCALADLRYDFSQTMVMPINEMGASVVRDVLSAQRAEGEARLAESGATLDCMQVDYVAEMSYAGQIHTLRVPIKLEWEPSRIEQAFEAAYHAEYGNTLRNIAVVLIGLKTTVLGVRHRIAKAPSPQKNAGTAQPRTYRDVYFGRWISTAVYDRRDLAVGMQFKGPAIIEQADTTTVIEPDMSVQIDDDLNILVEMD